MLSWLKGLLDKGSETSGDIGDQLQWAKLNRTHMSIETGERQITVVSKAGSHIVDFSELVAVEIITTDQGPFTDDLFYVFHCKNELVTIPSEAKGAEHVLPAIQSLPNFNNGMAIAAITNAENARFLVWETQNAAS